MKFRLIILLIICCSRLSAENSFSIWDEANASYDSSNFEQAVVGYNKLTKSGLNSAELQYNLGNAYYKMGIIGKSILHYERALKFKPNHKDCKHNLAIANALVVDEFETLPELIFISWWKRLVNLFSLKVWQYISLFFIWSSLIAWFFKRFTRIRIIKKAAGIKIFLFLFIGLLSALFMYGKYAFDNNSINAIILEPSVYSKLAPNESSEDAFILHEGAKISLLEKVGSYVEIKLPDGNKAWLEYGSFEEI